MTKEINFFDKTLASFTETEKEVLALDSETPESILLKLAFDSSENVRALVGINKNTPELILRELKKDQLFPNAFPIRVASLVFTAYIFKIPV